MLDGLADPYVGSAAADVAGHRLVDITVLRDRVACQECRCAHDLTGLAIATLHDLKIEPGLLNSCASRSPADRFNGGDFAIADAVDSRDAGANRIAVLMYGAGAAQCHAAPKLGAGHAEQVAQDPKQGRVAICIYDMAATIDAKLVGHLRLHHASVGSRQPREGHSWVPASCPRTS